MNTKNIPEDKKTELLKALQAVVCKIEEIEEEAKATQDTSAEHSLPVELEAAIKELHELAEKHDKTFVMAMDVFDDVGSSGRALSCYGTVVNQLGLVCDIIEQIAAACDKSAVEILKDLAKLMLMREMLSDDEEGDDASE